MRNTISSVAMMALLVAGASVTNGCSSDDLSANRESNVDDPGVTVNGSDIKGTGTVTHLNLEGGFWAIRGDNNRLYDPLGGLPAEFQQEGLQVKFAGKLRRDVGSIHMAGDIIELTSIQRR